MRVNGKAVKFGIVVFGVNWKGRRMVKHENEIILVGTFHLENEQGMEGKEEELHELVEFLGSFSPTKIAVEWERAKEEELIVTYGGQSPSIKNSEIEQIGFRLARKLQHEKVHAVNWAGRMTEQDVIDLNEAMQERYPSVLEKASTFADTRVRTDITLLESYKQLNDRESIASLEELYLSFADVEGADGELIGVNFLTKWMEREIRIMKNVGSLLCDGNHERILLIIGRDHLWMLQKLFEGRGWKVINPFEEV